MPFICTKIHGHRAKRTCDVRAHANKHAGENGTDAGEENGSGGRRYRGRQAGEMQGLGKANTFLTLKKTKKSIDNP